MTPRSLVVLLASAFALPLLLAGCGDDDTSTAAVSQATAPVVGGTIDRQIAEAAVLRPADLPAGWTAIPQDGQGRASCAAVQRLRMWPRAVSPGFARGDANGVHTVTIFPRRADADLALADLFSSANERCIARSIAEGGRAFVGPDVEVGKPLMLRLDVAPLAPRIRAVRYALPLGQGGVRAWLFDDYVDARVGRGIAIVWIHSRWVPPSARLRARLTQTAVERLTAALAAR